MSETSKTCGTISKGLMCHPSPGNNGAEKNWRNKVENFPIVMNDISKQIWEAQQIPNIHTHIYIYRYMCTLTYLPTHRDTVQWNWWKPNQAGNFESSLRKTTCNKQENNDSNDHKCLIINYGDRRTVEQHL